MKKFAILLDNENLDLVEGNKWYVVHNFRGSSYNGHINRYNMTSNEVYNDIVKNSLSFSGRNLVVFECSEDDFIRRYNGVYKIIEVRKIKSIFDLNQILPTLDDVTFILSNPYLETLYYLDDLKASDDAFINLGGTHVPNRISPGLIEILEKLQADSVHKYKVKLNDKLSRVLSSYKRNSSDSTDIEMFNKLLDIVYNTKSYNKNDVIKYIDLYLNSYKFTSNTGLARYNKDDKNKFLELIVKFDLSKEFIEGRFKSRSVSSRNILHELVVCDKDFFINNCSDFMKKYAEYVSTSKNYLFIRDLPFEYVTKDLFSNEVLNLILNKKEDDKLRKYLNIEEVPATVNFIIDSFDNINSYSDAFVYINSVSASELEKYVDSIAESFIDTCIKRSYSYMCNRSCGTNKENMEIFMKAVYRCLNKRNVRVITSFIEKCSKFNNRIYMYEDGRINWGEYLRPELFEGCENVNRVYLEKLL